MSFLQNNTGSRPGRRAYLTDADRKQKVAESNARSNRCKVYLGEQVSRWKATKEELGLKSHTELAKFLLDRYEKQIDINSSEKLTSPEPSPASGVLTSLSEPLESKLQGRSLHISSVPEILSSGTEHEMNYVYESSKNASADPSSSTSEVQQIDFEMSGVEEIVESQKKSLIGPFDITVDISDHFCDYNSDTSDDDYDPRFSITFCDKLNVDEEEDQEVDEDDETENAYLPVFDIGPGMEELQKEEMNSFLTDQSLLVYKECLMALARTRVKKKCNCPGPINLTTDVVGSAFYITWTCQSDHNVYTWCSQPLLKDRLHSGDLMLAAATVVSGNSYDNIALLAKAINLPILSTSSFFNIQKTYILPAIDHFWYQHQQDTLKEFQGKDITVLGDSRMDSQGHSVQYCSCYFMEMETKKILCIVTMDKKTTGQKSTNLKELCFEKALTFLIDSGVRVVEVVTDADVQIAALLKKPRFSAIKHSFDIWQGTKNLGKTIIKVCHEQGRYNIPLLNWTKEIIHHYCHCASISKTIEEFKSSWFGLLHHVVDEHEWLFSYDDNFLNSKCQHGPFTNEKMQTYLDKGSDALNALRRIVMDKRLVKNIPHYLNCRSKSDMETFQNLILAYVSEHHSHSPPDYHTRHLLAALDHNEHVSRPTVTKVDGTPELKKTFKKKSSRWTVEEMKAKKEYLYLGDIVREILTTCCT